MKSESEEDLEGLVEVGPESSVYSWTPSVLTMPKRFGGERALPG